MAQEYRAGSFLFYQNTQIAFTDLKSSRKTFLAKNKLPAEILSFDRFVAGEIIHELAHQLIQGPGHYNDSDGNGTPNQAATGPNDPGDFASVQFNYQQLAPVSTKPGLPPPPPPPAVVNGYNGQDYYPLPGQTFQFGHGRRRAEVISLCCPRIGAPEPSSPTCG